MSRNNTRCATRAAAGVLGVLLVVFVCGKGMALEVFSPADVLKTKICSETQISPDGKWIACTVGVPRAADAEPGGAYSELYLVSATTGQMRPFVTGKVNVSSIRWSPDGHWLAFLTSRGEKAKTQVWIMACDGGEAWQATCSKTGVSTFRWHPSGTKLAYVDSEAASDKEKKLEDKGYQFTFYEENLKARHLLLIDVFPRYADHEPEQLTQGVTVWGFEFSPDGKSIAAAISPENLVDHQYMFQKIHVLDLETKSLRQITDNPGKLGNFVFSPDGAKIAYRGALDRKDHEASQVFVINVNGQNLRNLTPQGFRGHVNWVGWKDRETIIYHAGEGVWPTLSLVKATGGERQVILDAQESGVVFEAPTFTDDFRRFAMKGTTPDNPGDVYFWDGKTTLRRLSSLNPWMAERRLGKQEVVRYSARDGLQIEGLLIYPVDYSQTNRYPLIVIVHGGPEAHYSNGWLTGYSSPGQVLAGKGYAVFYPNYRASTGYGYDFAMQGYGDPGGKEFDDIADGIDYLIASGPADAERVGLVGGSYGGYAAAWFASYYTKYVKAVCMFVGISNIISKRGTTDIPYEELYVHSGEKLEEMWDLNLKRSPIYWARQSRTAVLIMGGKDDTRVPPSQSIEFYRRLKMNDHPAVRLVQYPGEGHGNRKQPGRIDVLYRQLQWFDWYVKDMKPLDGPMPPLDISDQYGLELDTK